MAVNLEILLSSLLVHYVSSRVLQVIAKIARCAVFTWQYHIVSCSCDNHALRLFYRQLPYAEMGAKTLSLTVYDFDRFSKHDQIGQVAIPLNSVDLGQIVEEWRVLVSPITDEKVAIFNTNFMSFHRIHKPFYTLLTCIIY